MELILPTTPIPPLYLDPRCLVLYSLPKAAKTTILAQLPNSLIVDFEGGTDLLTAVKVKVVGLKPHPSETIEQRNLRWGGFINTDGQKETHYYASEIITALRKNNPYRFIILETVTRLEEMCEDDATVTYMNSPIGKNFNRWSEDDSKIDPVKYPKGVVKPRGKWESVLTLPKGAGYLYLRESFSKWVNYFKELSPYLILTAHQKILTRVDKVGKETSVSDLDLTGKIRNLTAQLLADAIGFVYRDGDKAYISFEPVDEVVAGNRSARLEGKHIFISEKLEDGTIKTYWESVFQSLANQS